MAEADTAVHSGQSRFPQTAWSLLARLKDPRDPQVKAFLDRMIRSYWRPVYKFIRISWSKTNEDAKDLTQAFFVHLLEGDLLARADPGRGNFRHLLLASLRNFLANDVRTGKALKRGGGHAVVALGEVIADATPAEAASPEDAFESQWSQDVLERSMTALESKVKPEVRTAFLRFHLEGRSIREIAAELAATESQVGHFLHAARVELRTLVMAEIRAYVHDETELAQELDALFRGWQ